MDEELKGGTGEGDTETIYPIVYPFQQRTHCGQIARHDSEKPPQLSVAFEWNHITDLAYTHMILLLCRVLIARGPGGPLEFLEILSVECGIPAGSRQDRGVPLFIVFHSMGR